MGCVLYHVRAVWAVRCFGSVYSKEVAIEQYVTCAELCQNACLFSVKAIDSLDVFRGGECGIDKLNPPISRASLPP